MKAGNQLEKDGRPASVKELPPEDPFEDLQWSDDVKKHCPKLRSEALHIHALILLKVNFQICVLLVAVYRLYLEILKSSDLLKNKMKLRRLESHNLMPFFHVCLPEISKIKYPHSKLRTNKVFTFSST